MTEEQLKKIEMHWTSHDSWTGEANIKELIAEVRRLQAEVKQLRRRYTQAAEDAADVHRTMERE